MVTHSPTLTHSHGPTADFYIPCQDSRTILLSMALTVTVSLGSESERNWIEPTEIRPLECKRGNVPVSIHTHIYLLLKRIY